MSSSAYSARPQVAAASSSTAFGCRYDVFLSFRGADTRKNFTDHLYAALKQAGFHTFRDDDEIRRGEDIDSEIQSAIHSTKLSLILFSRDYASSRWCLDELAMIMKLRRTAGHLVLPVFYEVDPSQVSEQTGKYGEAFTKHEALFKDELDRVNGWRVALKEASDLRGMVLRDRYQAQFVQDIVKEVSNKLNRKIFSVPSHFVGRDFVVNDVNVWLQSGLNDGSIAVVYGIGGVGKTTIAKTVYNQNFDRFEGRSFLSNVRERSEQPNGLIHLQEQLLSDVLNRKSVDKIYYVDAGVMKIKDAICCRKVLIVLDDLEKKDQLNAVIRMQSWLSPGSKIIITTRNESLLPAYEACVKFKVEPLDSDKSLQLFSWHAFGQTHPTEDYIEHSKSIIKYCSGLPLALAVVGSALSGKSAAVWQSALQEMENIPNGEIQKILKISYDSLNNDYHKNIFLDIACFFTEMNEDYVHKVLSGLGIDALFGVQNLIDRCLIEIDRHNNISMHQLIKDMGRNIAHEQLPRCERIWRDNEALTLLRENGGSETVHGLALDMHALDEDGHGRSFPLLHTNAFSKMLSLKYLKLNYVQLNGSYEHFPKRLTWLCWHGFSLNSIPKQIYLENLVVLDMHNSSLIDVWKGKMCLPKLKILDLSNSCFLRRTPDFSGVLYLEKLILQNCIRLVKIHESIGLLNSLKDLDLCGCSNLEGLPMGLGQLKVRRVLSGDSTVANISQHIKAIPWTLVSSFCSPRESLEFSASSLPCSLVRLNLSHTQIFHLPESIRNLNTLDWLWLSGCKRLQSLPELPNSLNVLNVVSCTSLQEIPQLPPMLHLQDCYQLVEVQDLIKQELIRTADFHMLRTVKMVYHPVLPYLLEIVIQPGILHIYLAADEITICLFEEYEDPWLIQEEGPDLTFNIPSSSLTTSYQQICGLTIWAVCCIPPDSDGQFAPHATIINQTKGSRIYCSTYLDIVPYLAETLHHYLEEENNTEIIWVSHWSLGNDELHYGDEVRVYLNPKPNIEIKKVGIKLIYQEEDRVSIVKEDEMVSEVEQDTPQSITSDMFNEYYCFLRYVDLGLYYRCAFVYFPNDPV